MVCKRFMFGAFAAMMLGGTAIAAPEILISPTVRNGSFELLGPDPGAVNAAKATNWDTDPDGDVTFWSEWGSAVGGPSIATTDSGTDTSGASTNGTKDAFFQGGDFAYNLTSHTIQVGDIFTYTWDWALVGRGIANAQLAYQQDATHIVAITGTDTTYQSNTAKGLGLGKTYKVLAGDPAIGHQIAFTVGAPTGSNYPEVDNINLFQGVLPGDVNLDGVINGADFNIIRDHFRQTVTDRSMGDLNGDNVVNFVDYLQWRSNAGPGAGALTLGGGSVPEPTGLTLAVIGMGAILAGRSRRKRCCA